MNGRDRDQYAPFQDRAVRVKLTTGEVFRGVLRIRSYTYITLDDDAVLTREHIVYLVPADGKAGSRDRDLAFTEQLRRTAP